MTRVYNFSAGPAALPLPVLQKMQAELLDFKGTGMSVMEMSHRGTVFTEVLVRARDTLRRLLNIPSNYHILFMQGGAIGENAIVPMNLLGGERTVSDHVISGAWSIKTQKEAGKYGESRIIANADDGQGRFTYYPEPSSWQLSDNSAYVAICTNETIHGVEWYPSAELTARIEASGSFLVSDMSSHILSRPLDVSRYGVIYGGAQKNIGPSGVTFVIVRDDLLDRAQAICPSAFTWRNVADNDSMFNTPPTLGIYCAGLVFEWLEANGGLTEMAKINDAKAKLLYDTIDNSRLYRNDVQPTYRSCMNVPFFLNDESLNQTFLDGALAAGLAGLKGHKMVGGMRASIYNAVSMEAVQALVAYMQAFERQHAQS
ncbi:3-phosphoserine/phosphohydroxythreonine transaminase [Hydromonas duriensis]|uniref:Phosphoserine aminotransferase n=1 Tax=Hydromonas duriensis TaxID=1527608 RepID=A0A4R6YAJ0_9BURK|nr:3-phosphoserine/phosphohydroxythreonine transaminase [Hydromonas duriensis]TDR32568.1 phosphoserine aminotransferase [Hydromonas duriensis]